MASKCFVIGLKPFPLVTKDAGVSCLWCLHPRFPRSFALNPHIRKPSFLRFIGAVPRGVAVEIWTENRVGSRIVLVCSERPTHFPATVSAANHRPAAAAESPAPRLRSAERQMKCGLRHTRSTPELPSDPP